MTLLHPFIELQTVGSTNLYAEQLLSTHKVREGTVIFAHEQTSGKGQGSNSWESEPGKNATFSLVLFPVFLPPGEQFMLSKSITLGILDFLGGFALQQELSVKWPNDVQVGNRKIAGILIHNAVCGSVYESCIAGIGVNINQETFSRDLPGAVSLKQLTGMNFPVRDAVDNIVAAIDVRYQQLRTGFTELLDRQYRDRLAGVDEWREYSVDKKLIKGRIVGVDDSGMLVVEMENGALRHFHHGEIGLILNS